MPEPRSPEQTEGSNHGFNPSVPYLRPNLGGYPLIDRDNPHLGEKPEFQNNEVGRRADILRHDHVYHADRVQSARARAEVFAERAEVGMGGAIEVLRSALEDCNPDSLMERAVLTEAMKILHQREEKLAQAKKDAANGVEEAQNKLDYWDETARGHYEDNEEAYKNQAVNDYRRAQSADPIRYPEPLNYPPYTDGTTEPQASSESHGQG